MRGSEVDVHATGLVPEAGPASSDEGEALRRGRGEFPLHGRSGSGHSNTVPCPCRASSTGAEPLDGAITTFGTPPARASRAARSFFSHPAPSESEGFLEGLWTDPGDERRRVLRIPKQSRNVRQQKERLGTEGHRHLGGRTVCVDVEDLSRRGDGRGTYDRRYPGVEEEAEETGIHLLDGTGQVVGEVNGTTIDDGPRSFLPTGEQEPVVDAGETHGPDPALGECGDDIGARHQFLPGPAVSANQHRAADARDLPRQRQDLFHARILGNDVAVTVLAAEFFPQDGIFTL